MEQYRTQPSHSLCLTLASQVSQLIEKGHHLPGDWQAAQCCDLGWGSVELGDSFRRVQTSISHIQLTMTMGVWMGAQVCVLGR